MNVYLIDTNYGWREVVTKDELYNEYASYVDKLMEDEEVWLIPYRIEQLNKARVFKNDREWCLDFEEDYGIQPDVYDILKHLWG